MDKANSRTAQRRRKGHWVLPPLAARPRLAIALVVGLLVGPAVYYLGHLHSATSAIIGWDVTCMVYAAAVMGAMANKEPHHIAATAVSQDVGRGFILGLVICAAVASIAAVAAERARRRRRTLTTILSAAAAVVLIAVGIGAGVVLLTPDDRVITASSSASGLSASADIVADGDGSQLTVSITGVPKGTDCVLTVHTVDGGSEKVVEWVAKYDGHAKVVGTSHAAPGTITRVTLERAGGVTLHEIPVQA